MRICIMEKFITHQKKQLVCADWLLFFCLSKYDKYKLYLIYRDVWKSIKRGKSIYNKEAISIPICEYKLEQFNIDILYGR